MLQVTDVSYKYDHDLVLDSINLDINKGEIICLLGESGSGKTTLLRAIAGLEAGYSGTITVNEQKLAGMPVHKRNFGLMFQDFALFPHMTVAQNVAFGLKMQGKSRQEQNRIVDEVLKLVGLDGYHSRSVDALSGGQKQRVALARSLAPQPRLLMLDEPLGALDAGLRERLVGELRQIIKQIGLTAIYVTHDQQEAYAIADRIALMDKGRIAQYAQPEVLYRQPESEFVARFLGLTNIVPSAFLHDYQSDASKLLLHPDSLQINPDGSYSGVLSERIFQGEFYRVMINLNEISLALLVSSETSLPDTGEEIRFDVLGNHVLPLYS